MSKNLKYKYKLLISNVVEGEDEEGYMAVIPAFNDALVFGDTMDELIEGVNFCIDTEVEHLKEAKKPIPIPEGKIQASGRILLRVEPFLHKMLLLKAKANQMSLNKYIESKLQS